MGKYRADLAIDGWLLIEIDGDVKYQDKPVEAICQFHELEINPSRRVGEELATDLRFHSMVLHASGNEMFAALTPSLLSMIEGCVSCML